MDFALDFLVDLSSPAITHSVMADQDQARVAGLRVASSHKKKKKGQFPGCSSSPPSD